MVVLGFFLYLLQFHKNPFDEYLVELPTLGNGMRPLLRNPWMLVHPPAQYFGYIGTTVPFAFAIASLLRPEGDGTVSDDWVRSMRPWIIGAWLFLGLGLVLGMVWAYELIDAAPVHPDTFTETAAQCHLVNRCQGFWPILRSGTVDSAIAAFFKTQPNTRRFTPHL